MKSPLVIRQFPPGRPSPLSCWVFSACWLALVLALAPTWLPLARGQGYDSRAPQEASVTPADPSELYLRAYTSVQQAEKLEGDGQLRPALSKYRFAASLLDQLSQTNPNWQPLIVRFRQRKTIESIRNLEEKGVVLQNPGPAGGAPGSAVPGNSYGQPATLPAAPPASNAPDDELPAPDGAYGQSMPRAAGPVSVTPQGPPPPPAVTPETVNRTAQELRGKLDKTQKDLKSALDSLAAAKQEKQVILNEKDNLESKLHSSQTGLNLAQKRFEHTKADRDELQASLAKAETRLNDATSKNPAVGQSRKELHDQVEDLKKQLAKAQAETQAAARTRDEVQAKFAQSEQTLAQTTQELNAAVARNELTRDAARKIEALQSENNTLSQKLSSAESSIVKLTAESLRKRQDLDGMQKELTTLKDQLASTRDQNDRNETTITELHEQLEDSAKRLAELKARGTSSEDLAKINKENEMLRDIVMRQLKDQSRRAAIKQMLAEELTRLDVQSSALNAQLEELGRPSVQLTDEERSLFKDPLITVADATSPSAMAATITTVRRPQPGAGLAASGGNPAAANASTPPEGMTPENAAPIPNANNVGPQVQTVSRPRVSDELLPMAREAKDDFDRQNYPEAERTYDKLLARDPKNPYLLSNQGVVLFRQDKLKSAEVMLKKAVAVAPSDPYSQATLGIVYYRMHRYDEAMRNLTTAIQLDPKNPTAHNYLGITASQKGYAEAAEEELEKAVALNANYADAHFNLAVVDATKQPSDKARAREHYNTAVRLGASPDPTLEKLIGN